MASTGRTDLSDCAAGPRSGQKISKSMRIALPSANTPVATMRPKSQPDTYETQPSGMGKNVFVGKTGEIKPNPIGQEAKAGGRQLFAP